MYKNCIKSCFYAIAAMMKAAGCKKDSKDDQKQPEPPSASSFAKGADVSWVTEMEAAGKKFYNKAGVATECMALLKSLGMNTIRLRDYWADPEKQYKPAAWKGLSFPVLKDSVFNYTKAVIKALKDQAQCLIWCRWVMKSIMA